MEDANLVPRSLKIQTKTDENATQRNFSLDFVSLIKCPPS